MWREWIEELLGNSRSVSGNTKVLFHCDPALNHGCQILHQTPHTLFSLTVFCLCVYDLFFLMNFYCKHHQAAFILLNRFPHYPQCLVMQRHFRVLEWSKALVFTLIALSSYCPSLTSWVWVSAYAQRQKAALHSATWKLVLKHLYCFRRPPGNTRVINVSPVKDASGWIT